MLNFFKTTFIASALLSTQWAYADDISVAVAANFANPMQEIATQFQQKTGHTLRISTGATGKFYTQIKNGAPFQVLLAADSETPARLECEGDGIAGTRFTYAIGELVLWSPTANLADHGGNVLRTGTFNHIALANAKLAPYGLAAQEVLTHMGVQNNLQSKIVIGENIAQTYQFVSTGNAELGFIARSQVQTNQGIAGSYWLIPQSMYSPITQQAIVLNNGKDNAAAQQLMQYLKSKKARDIISKYGYNLPK